MCHLYEQLRINRTLLNQILRHLELGLPHESCGLLATIAIGDSTCEAQAFFAGINLDKSPDRFTMDPRQVVAAFGDMQERGWSLGAIVHSHPAGPATPSHTDLRECNYPAAWMMIVSLAAENPEIRLWRSPRDGEPNPVELALSIFPE